MKEGEMNKRGWNEEQRRCDVCVGDGAGAGSYGDGALIKRRGHDALAHMTHLTLGAAGLCDTMRLEHASPRSGTDARALLHGRHWDATTRSHTCAG
jgi:hypothetical protein